jgi:type IV secretion system protein VirD4
MLAWVKAALGALAFLGIFTIVSSYLFLYSAGLLQEFDLPIWQFWLYLLLGGRDGVTTFCLLWSADSAVALISIPLFFFVLGFGIMSGRRLAWFIYPVIAPTAWLLLASALWCYGTHSPFTPWAWWAGAEWWRWRTNSLVTLWTYGAAVPPSFLAAITLAFVYQPRSVRWGPQLGGPTPTRVNSDMHGHARWSTSQENRRRWNGPDPVIGGIVMGEDYDPQQDRGPFFPDDPRTWGRGGRMPLLINTCKDGAPHGLVIAASNGFKSMCFATTLIYWRTSAVVLDPARELGPMVKDYREKALGHRVFMLDTRTAAQVGFNVLDWIDVNSPEAEGDVGTVVEWVCGSTPANTGSSARFFKNRGKAVVKAFTAHLKWAPDIKPELKTLMTVRDWISGGQDQVQEMLKLIAKTSKSRLALRTARSFRKIPEETWGGIYQSADDDTDWLSALANAQLVSGNSFRSSDITRGDTDVFIQLSLKVLEASPGLARCIVGALLNAVYEADGDIVGRALFLLDEMRQLGYHRTLKVARDAGRRVGITIVGGYQSEGQIEDQWGGGAAGRAAKEEWYQTCWRSFSVINELSTAEMISRACGTYGALSWSESFRRRFAPGQPGSINYSDRAVPLVRASDILADWRRDTQIIMPGSGEKPARIGRAMWFRRRELIPLIKPSRFTTYAAAATLPEDDGATTKTNEESDNAVTAAGPAAAGPGALQPLSPIPPMADTPNVGQVA